MAWTVAGVAFAGYYYPDPPDDPPLPGAEISSAISGLWFDPSLDGEGYNFIMTEGSSGPVLVIFYYGYSAIGERLWLVSENVPANFALGEPVQAALFEARGGRFDAPAPSPEALSAWGTITVQIDSCVAGTILLDGVDGHKTSLITKLAGIAELTCGAKGVTGGRAGLWYDASLDGEGYNVIASGAGTVVFYYGYNAAGERLWLISDVASDDRAFTVPVWEAVGGNFATPAPSDESLRAWGSITVDLACGDGSITLDGSDGVKSSAVVKLAGIQGTSCN